jgi:hypothetical protein
VCFYQLTIDWIELLCSNSDMIYDVNISQCIRESQHDKTPSCYSCIDRIVAVSEHYKYIVVFYSTFLCQKYRVDYQFEPSFNRVSGKISWENGNCNYCCHLSNHSDNISFWCLMQRDIREMYYFWGSSILTIRQPRQLCFYSDVLQYYRCFFF